MTTTTEIKVLIEEQIIGSLLIPKTDINANWERVILALTQDFLAIEVEDKTNIPSEGMLFQNNLFVETEADKFQAHDHEVLGTVIAFVVDGAVAAVDTYSDQMFDWFVAAILSSPEIQITEI
jgi:hypothetical protein